MKVNRCVGFMSRLSRAQDQQISAIREELQVASLSRHHLRLHLGAVSSCQSGRAVHRHLTHQRIQVLPRQQAHIITGRDCLQANSLAKRLPVDPQPILRCIDSLSCTG